MRIAYVVKLLPLPALLLAAGLALTATGEAAAAGEPAQAADVNTTCAACHGQPGLTINLGADKVSLHVPANALAGSMHRDMACTGCHRAEAAVPHTAAPAGNSLRAYRVSQNDVCGNCHLKQYYHGPDAAHTTAGGDAPLCTDCHTAHAVQDPASTGFRLQSVSLCTQCHLDQNLMAKYGVNARVGQTYLQDFHGKTQSLLSLEGPGAQVREAVCADCHGAHNILKPGTATWTATMSGSSQLCVKCHPGASSSFSAAFLSHTEPSITHAPLVLVARWFYWIMIPFVVVGLAIHIILDIVASRQEGA